MFDRILGLTMPWALKTEALEYSKKFGYPISPDAITGIPNERGQGDVRDAFRHLYGTAVFAYEGGIKPARDIAEWGEVFGGNPELIAEMDRKNNAVAIDIARKVRAKFAGNTNVTERQIKDEIAREAHDAISTGKATFYVTRDNDADYTPPTGVFDPSNDVEDNSFFGSIGDGLSDAAGGIGDFFSSIGSGISGAFSSIAGSFGLAQQVASSTSAPFLGGINPSRGHYFSRFTTAAELAQALHRSRRAKLERDIIDILSGATSGGGAPFVIEENFSGRRGGGFTAPPIVPDGSGNALKQTLGSLFDNIIGSAFNRHRSRTTTSTAESARSRTASQNWRLSSSQQAAQLAHFVQSGAKNA